MAWIEPGILDRDCQLAHGHVVDDLAFVPIHHRGDRETVKPYKSVIRHIDIPAAVLDLDDDAVPGEFSDVSVSGSINPRIVKIEDGVELLLRVLFDVYQPVLGRALAHRNQKENRKKNDDGR